MDLYHPIFCGSFKLEKFSADYLLFFHPRLDYLKFADDRAKKKSVPRFIWLDLQ